MFKANPNFETQLKDYLSGRLQEITDKLAEKSREIIQTERFWEGWTVTNPIRDIVDTQALDNSMKVEEIDALHYRITWETDYVTYVYFGYTTQSGRRIPPRKWVELAIAENDWDSVDISVNGASATH